MPLKVNTNADLSGGTAINDVVANNNNMTKVIVNGGVTWQKVTASFGGLSGATPSSYNSQVVIADQDQVTSPGSPTKTGYTFNGWDPSLPRTISADTTFNATFSENTYTITYTNLQGQTHTNPSTYQITDTPITFSNPSGVYSRTGYQVAFAGWNPTGISAGATGNKSTAATWTETANTYYVAFDKNDSGATGTMANQTFTYDSAQNLTANGFSKTGYSFAGWATSAGGAVVYANSASVNNLTTTNGGTVTLYAKWTINSYTITFDSNGGTAVASQVKNYNTTLAEPTAPTRTGYTFNGWYYSETNNNGSGTAVS